jgi:hypothetical protein
MNRRAPHLVVSCSRCATPTEPGDLRCAVCALVLVAPASPSPDAPRASVLRCTDCAAAIAFSAEEQAPHCAFCGAVMQIEHPVDPLEVAEARLPFSVSHDSAAHALRRWLGRRGWLHPRDLATGARLSHVQPIYWAAWIVDARALVSWTADSDHNSGLSKWAPHSGTVTMDFDGIVVPATRGLSWKECAALTPHYTLSSATALSDDPYSDAHPANIHDGTIESFDAQRSAARATVLAAIEATAAARLQRTTIPGRRFRNVKVGVFLQALTTRRVALPAWVLAYRYRGALYRGVVHGQRDTCVLGRAPYSLAKLAALALTALALVAVLVLLFARA